MNDKFELYGVIWEIHYGLSVQGDDLEYNDIIKILHPTVNWFFEEDEDYQGDFYGCGYDADKYWYFIEGSFGSCSGCDWLQSLSDEDDAKKFLRHFKNVIIKKASRTEILNYMRDTLVNKGRGNSLQKLIKTVEKADVK